MKTTRFSFCSGLFSSVLVSACGGGTAAVAPVEPPAAETPTPAVVEELAPVEDAPSALDVSLALARGGRLFDKWWVEAKVEFSPDAKGTPEADGKGGPFSNGTLPGVDGKPVLNSGHDYRLKNFFGWDLRGSEGIYGPKFQNKSYVQKVNLLADKSDKATWVARLTDGHEGLPAYGKVLDEAQIAAIVDFILAMRDGSTVAPQGVFELSETAPKNYTLLSGGDAEKGQAYLKAQCAGCHGDDGTSFYIDDKYSLGMYGRSKAYETWIKLLNGQPGTKMGPQLTEHRGFEAQSQAVKDMLAALCDRSLYPRGEAKGEDVADGDVRCGAYLK